MNKIPNIRLVYDRRKKATKMHSRNAKKAEVLIEVYFDRLNRYYIKTGVMLFTEQWRNDRVTSLCPYMAAYNDRLDMMMRKINRYITLCADEGTDITFDSIVDYVAPKVNQRTKLVDYIVECVGKREDCSKETKKNHMSIARKICEYGKLVYLEDLNYDNIKAFDDWLRRKDYCLSTIHNFHKVIKVYVHEAIKAKVINSDPYVGFYSPRGIEQKRKYLNDEELNKVINCETKQQIGKDLFLFQCYTGLAYADMSAIDWDKDIEVIAGRKTIVRNRVKTKTQYYVTLIEQAVDILDKYGGSLPIITNQAYNRQLKQLQIDAALRIDKLTTHMARHTFATYALRNGISIEHLAKMLGHTNIATTQIYAKLQSEDIASDYDKIEARRKH